MFQVRYLSTEHWKYLYICLSIIIVVLVITPIILIIVVTRANKPEVKDPKGVNLV